ncbi:mRNA capping enzyme, catalytic domain-containing protein [Neohortaea acidophila]|uniref:mRNA-capping enzyme subunit alpha n=1 Tax=Neohortaea acidophila TaxID=245834 RepID=A0A6A6PML2_9PEZI|nr:mRNA capping enzyme, catalytic domain-containing protein [Neohortaea acidophila]KAF2481348.1 mRNA capping enzyme, catalytic domain-containing protein [Neohortaea acidophila]
MGSSINLDAIGIRLSGEDVHLQRSAVCDLLDDKTIRFPGAQPVSFARRHLAELRHVDYFMCEKTDGVRCLLFLTQIFIDGEGVEAQFLIDRKNDYYYVPRDALHLPRLEGLETFHTGTLLDGELVRQTFRNGQQERLAYLIFDCLAIDGENVTSRPFDKRLARIEALITKPYQNFAKQFPQDVAAQPFQLEMKKMEFPYGMEMMFRDRIPNLPHGNDGLIFTCKGTAYKTGTDEHILKWKPPQENTVDFRLLLGAFPSVEDEEDGVVREDYDAMPEMELYVNYGDRRGEGYKSYGPLKVTEAEWSAMKKLNQQLDGRIIECYKDPATGGWRPKVEKDGAPRFRDDKKDANHITVVESVQESIDDAVTEQDLVREAMNIREAFKGREKARKEEERRRMEAERVRQEERKRRASEVRNGMDDGPTYAD